MDKDAGDAVMATFNLGGGRLEHCTDALQAALAIRDKAALADLEIGVGLATGSAIVGRLAGPDANLSVLGQTTNLAARLQAAPGRGEILLSPEAWRRSNDWLAKRDIATTARRLPLKGIAKPVEAHVLAGLRPAARETIQPPAALSKRQLEILRLLAAGGTDAEIAGQLLVSVNTVRSDLHRIRNLLGVRRRSELASYAAQAGIARAGNAFPNR